METTLRKCTDNGKEGDNTHRRDVAAISWHVPVTDKMFESLQSAIRTGFDLSYDTSLMLSLISCVLYLIIL